MGFTVTLTNAGPGTSRATNLTDPLPAGTSQPWRLDPAVDGCTIAGGQLDCRFGDLGAGATRTVNLWSQAGATAGPLDNAARVSAANVDPAACTTCKASAAIAVQASLPRSLRAL